MLKNVHKQFGLEVCLPQTKWRKTARELLGIFGYGNENFGPANRDASPNSPGQVKVFFAISPQKSFISSNWDSCPSFHKLSIPDKTLTISF